MPTKETWNQLLVHFDRMTQQQTQLIEMVSSFGDSSRERLETLEQKVYSIELRLSGMEQRQSFGHPAFPPTPARAIRGPFLWGLFVCVVLYFDQMRTLVVRECVHLYVGRFILSVCVCVSCICVFEILHVMQI